MSKRSRAWRPFYQTAVEGAAGRSRRGGGLPSAATISFMGDSITQYNATSNLQIDSGGFGSWARGFGGSKWDFAPFTVAGQPELWAATGGSGTAYIIANHLSQVQASGADACVILAGTNDWNTLTSAACVANLVTLWTGCRSSGVIPIATTIWPVVANATKSSWIVATNALIRAAAAANNVLLCDWTGEIEDTPNSNTGVSNTTWLPDNTHPDTAAAAQMGRFLRTFLEANFRMPFDPWAGITAVTPNPTMIGSTAGPNPPQWANPSVPASGTLNSRSLVADDEFGEGQQWWQFDVTQGAATGFFSIQCGITTFPDITGTPVFGMCQYEVVSGTFIKVVMRRSAGAGNNNYDLFSSTITSSAGLTAADGIGTLRSPVSAAGSGTYYTPLISFAGTGVIRFRRAGLYQMTP